jgi:hypothetical protein
MSELDYYKLPQFVDRVSKGLEGPQSHIRIPTMCGNQIHNISFLDHCDELCKKHNTDRLRLLSVIQQKLNGDMIVRLNDSPVFNQKVKQVLNEWGEKIDPIELFKCPNNCYDNKCFVDMKNLYQTHVDTLESLNLNADNLESSIYNSVEYLKNDFNNCEEVLRDNLSQIETRQYEYEPKYRAILCDLSTKQKPFYLDGLMKSEEQTNMIHHVNRKVNRHIPDNINIIFLNIILIPTLIAKEMERIRKESFDIKQQIENRQKILSEIMEKIGPNEPLSIGFLKMLSGLTDVFNVGSDDDLPEDEEDEEDDKIEGVMKNIVEQKKNIDNKDNNKKKADEEKMYYLDVKPKSVNESDKNDTVSDNLSFVESEGVSDGVSEGVSELSTEKSLSEMSFY